VPQLHWPQVGPAIAGPCRSLAHFHDGVERSVRVPNGFVRQGVGHPLSINDELVFVPARLQIERRFPMPAGVSRHPRLVGRPIVKLTAERNLLCPKVRQNEPDLNLAGSCGHWGLSHDCHFLRFRLFRPAYDFRGRRFRLFQHSSGRLACHRCPFVVQKKSAEARALVKGRARSQAGGQGCLVGEVTFPNSLVVYLHLPDRHLDPEAF
jgi:hypothetical protein